MSAFSAAVAESGGGGGNFRQSLIAGMTAFYAALTTRYDHPTITQSISELSESFSVLCDIVGNANYPWNVRLGAAKQIKAIMRPTTGALTNVDMGPGPGLILSTPIVLPPNEQMVAEIARRIADDPVWAACYNEAPYPS
jgi:hypothetical protein